LEFSTNFGYFQIFDKNFENLVKKSHFDPKIPKNHPGCVILDLKLFNFGFNGLTMLVVIKYLRKNDFFVKKVEKKQNFWIFGFFSPKFQNFDLLGGPCDPPGGPTQKKNLIFFFEKSFIRGYFNKKHA